MHAPSAMHAPCHAVIMLGPPLPVWICYWNDNDENSILQWHTTGMPGSGELMVVKPFNHLLPKLKLASLLAKFFFMYWEENDGIPDNETLSSLSK